MHESRTQAGQLISILIFSVTLCIAAHHMIWVLCSFFLCAANRFAHKNVLQHDPIEYIYWGFFRFASVACDSIAWSSQHFRRHIEPSRSISTSCMGTTRLWFFFVFGLFEIFRSLTCFLLLFLDDELSSNTRSHTRMAWMCFHRYKLNVLCKQVEACEQIRAHKHAQFSLNIIVA